MYNESARCPVCGQKWADMASHDGMVYLVEPHIRPSTKR